MAALKSGAKRGATFIEVLGMAGEVLSVAVTMRSNRYFSIPCVSLRWPITASAATR